MRIVKYLPLLAALALVGCEKPDPDRAIELEHAQAVDADALLRELRGLPSREAEAEAERQRLAREAEEAEAKRQRFAREAEEAEARRQEHLNRYGQFQIHNNGTVTIQGLQWMRCSFGQEWKPDRASRTGTCSGYPLRVRWNETSELVRMFNEAGGFAGRTDWRLPTITELEVLRLCSTGHTKFESRVFPGGFHRCDGKFDSPTIDLQVFPNTSRSWEVWSSSTRWSFVHLAETIDFGKGKIGARRLNKYYMEVLLVRDG